MALSLAAVPAAVPTTTWVSEEDVGGPVVVRPVVVDVFAASSVVVPVCSGALLGEGTLAPALDGVIDGVLTAEEEEEIDAVEDAMGDEGITEPKGRRTSEDSTERSRRRSAP